MRKLFVIAVLLFVVINVGTFSYAIDQEYYIKNQESILKNIKIPEEQNYIRSIIRTIDEYLDDINISEGKQLDGIDDRFIHSDLYKNNISGGYGLGQRKSERKRIRNSIITAAERNFKIYVSKGTFGKYNKNMPVVVPDYTKFYAYDSKGHKWQFSTGRDRYILPTNKSEMFLEVTCIQGITEETIPANLDWTVDGIKGSKAIRVTNLKSIKLAENVYESDNDYKKRMIENIDYIRGYVLQRVSEVNQ